MNGHSDLSDTIRRAAITSADLHDRFKESLRNRDVSKKGYSAYLKALQEWRKFRLPGDVFWSDEELLRLEAGNEALLDLAIAFVEVDPCYFRSGYLKTRLFRRLRRMKLTESQRDRLLAAILSAVQVHKGDGWKEFCMLAGKFGTSDFIEKIRRLASDRNPFVAERANAIIQAIKMPNQSKDSAP